MVNIVSGKGISKSDNLLYKGLDLIAVILLDKTPSLF
jgi:hypothetical protein